MKVQVNLNDDLVSRIDDYAKYMGISRSALCAMFIGQGMLGLDKSIEIVKEYGKQAFENSEPSANT